MHGKCVSLTLKLQYSLNHNQSKNETAEKTIMVHLTDL